MIVWILFRVFKNIFNIDLWVRRRTKCSLERFTQFFYSFVFLTKFCWHAKCCWRSIGKLEIAHHLANNASRVWCTWALLSLVLRARPALLAAGLWSKNYLEENSLAGDILLLNYRSHLSGFVPLFRWIRDWNYVLSMNSSLVDTEMIFTTASRFLYTSVEQSNCFYFCTYAKYAKLYLDKVQDIG